MTDKVSKAKRSKIMQAIKSSDTALEKDVRKKLWKIGFRFRKNVSDLPGKPDIAIKKYKIAVFIDSCFWHGCSLHCRLPSSNSEYWVAKIERNMRRDETVNKYYREQGWNIIRVWEHQLRGNHDKAINEIADFIELATLKTTN
jgi:DNA mismatch endonuclease, patch repair protein